MQQDSRSRLKQWLESGEARLQPLSYSQRELYETSPVPVGSPANHICCFIEIKGSLTEKESEVALQRVVDRQEALRISLLPGKERPLQLVRSTGKAHLRYRELTAEEVKPAAFEEVLKETYQQPFDMVQGPLYRVDMLRRASNDHVMAFSIHHSIADGWSLGVFVQDLCTAYVMGLSGLRKAVAVGIMGVPDALPAVPQSYSEWAAQERATWTPEELAPRLDYWKSTLAGSKKLWPAEGAVERAAQRLSRWAENLPAKPTAAVRDLSRRSGATLYSTLLAAFQITLWKWTRQADIVIGSPLANRNKASARQTMGYFSGVMPVRGQVDDSRTVMEHLRATQEASVDALANAVPFVEIAKAVGEPQAPGLHSIFDVRFALQNHLSPDIVLPRISTKLRMRSTGTARFDLACEVTEIGDELEVVWMYKPLIFSESSIAEIHSLFVATLAKCCQGSGSRISALAV